MLGDVIVSILDTGCSLDSKTGFKIQSPYNHDHISFNQVLVPVGMFILLYLLEVQEVCPHCTEKNYFFSIFFFAKVIICRYMVHLKGSLGIHLDGPVCPYPKNFKFPPRPAFGKIWVLCGLLASLAKFYPNFFNKIAFNI